jgi:hypothetical protein
MSVNSNPILFPQHDPLIHKHLLCSLTLGRAREYSWVALTLAPFSPTPMSSNTNSTLTTLYHESNDYFMFFFKDYKLDQDFKLSYDSFKLAFQHMLHLSASGPYGMVFKHPPNCFLLIIQRMDSLNCFDFLLILNMVIFHPKLHTSLEWPAF